jgi:hypothetical protein
METNQQGFSLPKCRGLGRPGFLNLCSLRHRGPSVHFCLRSLALRTLLLTVNLDTPGAHRATASASPAIDIMASPHLLGIPRELRNNIYDYLFEWETVDDWHCDVP